MTSYYWILHNANEKGGKYLINPFVSNTNITTVVSKSLKIEKRGWET